jgi:hypothetical protein
MHTQVLAEESIVSCTFPFQESQVYREVWEKTLEIRLTPSVPTGDR